MSAAYVRGCEFPGIVPTWHRLVALAGCSTRAYWRCFPGVGFAIDASSSLVPTEGRMCRQCAYVQEVELPSDDSPRKRMVVRISNEIYREVGSGELLELDGRHVWRTRPNYVWSTPA